MLAATAGLTDAAAGLAAGEATGLALDAAAGLATGELAAAGDAAGLAAALAGLALGAGEEAGDAGGGAVTAVLDAAVGWGGAGAGAGALVHAVASRPSIVTIRPTGRERTSSERESIEGLQIAVISTARPKRSISLGAARHGCDNLVDKGTL